MEGRWRPGALPLGATRNLWGSGGQRSDLPGVLWGRSSGQRTFPGPSRQLEGGVLPSLCKARVISVLRVLPGSSSLLSSSSDSRFPFASELSPPGLPLPTFSLLSPSPPSFLLHRTRRVSFIYLFFTPAINTLLGLPSFSMWVGGEKGRKCWLEGVEVVPLGERFCPGINDWGKAGKRSPICL